ncbi:MAG: lysophospholipid acyltransferase family protein [Cellvibrionaceae bacterium]|nr:lysophospholipid acyltransferase family protein [Cellvibrionaceae bacterium]
MGITQANIRQTIKGHIIAGLLTLAGKLPLWAARCLGSAAGTLLWYLPNYSQHVTQRNIALCFPELSPAQQRQLMRRSLQHTGMLALEMALVWHRPYAWLQQRIKSIEGQAIVDAALSTNKGLMVLAPHLGNWEVVGAYMATLTPMVNLYEPPALPAVDALIQRGRSKTGAQLAPTNPRGIARLLKQLRRGDAVGILPDQVPEHHDRGGAYASFFAHPAYTMTLATQLLQKTQCTIVFAVAQRIKGGFKLTFTEAPTAIYSEQTRESVSGINHLTETLVRQIPAQYQWEYKRFKRLPQGYKEIY